jgi:hypothetical protein
MNEGQVQEKRLLQLISTGDEAAFKTLFESTGASSMPI